MNMGCVMCRPRSSNSLDAMQFKGHVSLARKGPPETPANEMAEDENDAEATDDEADRSRAAGVVREKQTRVFTAVRADTLYP